MEKQLTVKAVEAQKSLKELALALPIRLAQKKAQDLAKLQWILLLLDTKCTLISMLIPLRKLQLFTVILDLTPVAQESP
jgi:hypothetical protein